MTDLIARLSEATNSYRDHDVQIARTLGAEAQFFMGTIGYKMRNVPWVDYDTRRWVSLPNFTDSIDAAARLIRRDHSFGGLMQVSPTDWLMTIFSRTDSKARWEGEARTAPNAICIAVLLSRAAVTAGERPTATATADWRSHSATGEELC